MPTTFNRAYYYPDYGDNTNRDEDHGGCPSGWISRKRKGRSGRRRHMCIKPDTTYISHKPDRTGSNPCTLAGANSASWIGGGVNGRGHQNDFSGRSSNFSTSDAALKCTFNSVTGAKLIEMSRSGDVLDSGATDSSGFKNQWQQLVFGIQTDAGNNSTGFCADLNNLTTQIHQDGSTCYSILTDAATKKTRGIQWCQRNRSDDRCGCINVADYGTAGCIDSHSNLPGCREVKAEYDKYPQKAKTAFPLKTFTAKCFVPNLCSRNNQFQPASQPDVCSQTIAVCEQTINVGDITGGKVDIAQEMECEAKSTQGSGDATSTDTGAGAGTDTGAGAEEEEKEKEEEEEETGIRAYIPTNLSDLKTDRKKQLTAGGLVGTIMMSAFCLIVIILLLSSDGNSRPTRFRR